MTYEREEKNSQLLSAGGQTGYIGFSKIGNSQNEKAQMQSTGGSSHVRKSCIDALFSVWKQYKFDLHLHIPCTSKILSAPILIFNSIFEHLVKLNIFLWGLYHCIFEYIVYLNANTF